MTLPRAFKAFKKSAHFVPHRAECPKKGSNVPIDSCPCDCYEYFIFEAGYRSARGVAPKRRILNQEQLNQFKEPT